MKQLKVSLPDDLRDQLEKASGKAGHSLGEEVRGRLERSFAEDAALDPITRELVAGIINLATAVQADLGAQWHTFPAVHKVFTAAVAQRIGGYKPRTNPGLGAATLDLLGKVGAAQVEQAPDAVGGTIERADQRVHSYEQLQSALRSRMAQLAKHIRKDGDKS
jgi:hypothetical protein